MQTNLNRRSFAPFSLALVAMLLLNAGCTPSGPKALLQGEDLIRKGKYEAAIDKLETAVDLLPNEARAWNFLGVAHHRAGQFADARLAYERALQLDRDLSVARFNLGKMYLDQGVPISALEQLSTFVMLDQKSVEGWLLMGDANLELLRYDQALDNYSTALKLQRDAPSAYNGIGLIYMNRNDPRKAYQMFVEALKFDPDYTPAILNLAVVLHTRLDAKPLALAKYREYLAKAPNAANRDLISGLVRRLNLELNPPMVEKIPAVIPMAETNLTRVPPPVEPAVTEAEETTKPEPPVESAKVELAATVVKKTEPEKEAAPKPVEKKPEVAVATPPPKTTEPPAKTETIPIAVPVAEKKPEQTKPPVKKVPSPVVEKELEVVVKKPAAAPPKQVASVTEEVAPKQPPPAKAATPVAEKPVDEEPLEVVQLDVDDIAATQDIPVPQQTPSARPDVPASEPDLPVANSPPTTVPPTDPVEEPAKKRGFFQKINPVNLFRGEEDEKQVRSDEIVTPLPPVSSPPPDRKTPPQASTPRTVASAGEYSGVTPMRSSQGPRRYSYSQSGAPQPGDRAAAERLFQRGLDAQTRLDPGRAASFFASAAMADPSYFPAQYNLGLLSYQTGQTMKSLSAFETALALDPNSAEARYNFALSLQKTKYALDAVNELNILLSNSPDNLRAHLLLGNLYAQDLDNFDHARSEYQKVLELDSAHSQAPAIRAWLNEHP